MTHRQLLVAGVTRREIERRQESGRLVGVHVGVYRVAGVRPSYEQAVMAACLATGGVASHRTAARLFHLRGFERFRAVEITVQGPRAPRLDGVVAHRTRKLHPTKIGVIPVTMPAQTLLGLAAVAPKAAEGAVNDVLARGLGTLSGLVRFVLEQGRSGRNGTVRLRELLEDQIKGKAPTESWLEDRLLDLIRAYGLPEPVRQFRLEGMRFDFAYPELPLDVEADSRLWHSTPDQLRQDEERDRTARGLGWAVERVTWLQLEEEPATVAARLRRWFEPVKAAA